MIPMVIRKKHLRGGLKVAGTSLSFGHKLDQRANLKGFVCFCKMGPVCVRGGEGGEREGEGEGGKRRKVSQKVNTLFNFSDS